jgi:RNA polymerase sigma factor (sigma-70 family)
MNGIRDYQAVADRNEAISLAVKQESKQLLEFIKRRVPDDQDAEDVLQDVFYQLTDSWSLIEPIERLSAWLYRVARNRIIDRYRKKRAIPESAFNPAESDDGEEVLSLTQILPDLSSSPDAEMERTIIWEALEDALNELPQEQRETFVMHELEGRSFEEMVQITGVNKNSLLSRKRYAVLHLRERLRELYDNLLNER